jgi:plasmid stabilization system protein ParE
VLVLTALAAGAGRAAVDLGAAKRELWSTLVAVEDVSAALRGLQAIAGDSQAYDVAVAGELRDRAAQDLRRAEQHLGRLWRLPGQEDGTLQKVAAVQDALRKLRERVQRLGRGPTCARAPPAGRRARRPWTTAGCRRREARRWRI